MYSFLIILYYEDVELLREIMSHGCHRLTFSLSWISLIKSDSNGISGSNLTNLSHSVV